MKTEELEKYPFKQRLVMLRTAKGLSQVELSRKINANASSIGAWELGNALPKGDKLQALSDVLGIPHDVWVRWRIEENTKNKERKNK